MPRARTAIEKALELDPSLGEAHTWLGVIALLFDWDHEQAERELVRAMSLNPRYPLAHVWHAILLATLGRHDEGLRSIARALAIDPLNLAVNLTVGRSCYWARRWDEALHATQATLRSTRDTSWATCGWAESSMRWAGPTTRWRPSSKAWRWPGPLPISRRRSGTPTDSWGGGRKRW